MSYTDTEESPRRGEHRLDARSRHGANGAALVADDAKGTSIGIFVDAGGAITIRK